ncbi:MAG TPA: M20/M25/M40 family metallo-hydrolase [Gemmatimonadaceae bacterium]|nr:M20/M25/M40 family metallo-hydrolase [Gemmatimonadaceae bacterium]
MPRLRPFALILAASVSFSHGERALAQTPVDWNALTNETVRVLSDYIKINTTNPPGNELQAARFLKQILDKEGIEARILDTAELAPSGRANLYARIKGNGSKKAIALVHHMDVVPVTPSFWSVDPFAGLVKDGYIWGRGTIDMKGEGIVQLMTMIAIKRSGLPLSRDIVFIGNADEELGSTGAVVFVKRHPDLLEDVEYLMTEGGGNQVERGKLAYYGVGVAEKRTFWQRVSVRGTPSHASRPTKLNPVPKLVAALDKIARYETPLHATPGVAKYFHDIARTYPEPQRTWLSDVAAALNNAKARDWITNDVYWNAILRNTISLTALQGSNKTNVIPAEATAELDIRLLPDTDPVEFMKTLRRIVGDTAVHFTTLLEPKPPLENPIATDLFRAIERASHDRDPNALVTTPMLTAATDRPTYRALGIITYGFDPFKIEASDLQTGMHGNNERISVDNVAFGLKYTYDVLRYVQ